MIVNKILATITPADFVRAAMLAGATFQTGPAANVQTKREA
jgi:hypothetical protein